MVWVLEEIAGKRIFSIPQFFSEGVKNEQVHTKNQIEHAKQQVQLLLASRGMTRKQLS